MVDNWKNDSVRCDYNRNVATCTSSNRKIILSSTGLLGECILTRFYRWNQEDKSSDDFFFRNLCLRDPYINKISLNKRPNPRCIKSDKPRQQVCFEAINLPMIERLQGWCWLPVYKSSLTNDFKNSQLKQARHKQRDHVDGRRGREER